MGKSARPNGWPRIERNIKLRAEFRCECGTFADCDSNAHHGRCQNNEGNRYPHNKRMIKLRVVQVRPGSDWRGPNLIAVCLPCMTLLEKRQTNRTKHVVSQQESLF
jgi:hypothetical protein